MSPSSAATHSPSKVLNRSSGAEVGRAGAGAGAAAAAPAARTRATTTADRGTFTGISASPSPGGAPLRLSSPSRTAGAGIDSRGEEIWNRPCQPSGGASGTLPSRYEHRDPGRPSSRHTRTRQRHAHPAGRTSGQGAGPASEGAPGPARRAAHGSNGAARRGPAETVRADAAGLEQTLSPADEADEKQDRADGETASHRPRSRRGTGMKRR